VMIRTDPSTLRYCILDVQLSPCCYLQHKEYY